MSDCVDLLTLRLHAAGAARRAVHRARRAGGRHLPRPAPAGADGRRHRPRRRHRRRARPAHRHLAHLDRGRRRDPRRRPDRADPRARPHQRRRRAGAAVLRRHRRRRADHRPRRAERGQRCSSYLFGSITTHLRRPTCWVTIGAGRGRASSSASACSPSCSRSPRTRSSPGSPGCTVRVYNLLVAVLAAVTVTVAMRTVGLLLVSRADGGAGRDRAAAHPLVPDDARGGDGRSASLASLGGLVLAAFASYRRTRRARRRRSCCSRWPAFALDLAGRRAGCAGAQRLRAPFPEPTTRWPRTTVTDEPPARARRGLRPPGGASTATTSTTSTTATGTPSTESTMTSTEPRRHRRLRPDRPGSGGRSPTALATLRRLPQRPGDPRPARRSGGEPVGLATVYRTLQTLADAGEVDMLRTEDGEAIYRRCSRHAPPPPGLPRLRRDRRGRGPGRRAVDPARSPPSTASPTSATPWRSSGPARPAARSGRGSGRRSGWGWRRRSGGRGGRRSRSRRHRCAPVDVGPQHVGEHHLGVRRLPEHEVRQPLLARRAPDQVGVRQLGDVEVAWRRRFSSTLSGLSRPAATSRRDRAGGVGELGAAAVVDAHRQREHVVVLASAPRRPGAP